MSGIVTTKILRDSVMREARRLADENAKLQKELAEARRQLAFARSSSALERAIARVIGAHARSDTVAHAFWKGWFDDGVVKFIAICADEQMQSTTEGRTS